MKNMIWPSLKDDSNSGCADGGGRGSCGGDGSAGSGHGGPRGEEWW